MNNKNIVDLDNNVLIRSNNIIHNSKTLNDTISNLENLDTNNKTNLVGAINEINTNDIKKGTYSINEVKFGSWIDGKPLYRKCLDLGYLGNKNEVSIHIGAAIKNIVNIYGCARNSSGLTIPLPYCSTNVQEQTKIYVRDNYLYVDCSSDRSAMYAYIIIEYTKITD